MNKNKRLSPSDPVTALAGVGTKRAETLLKLEIKTISDLLRHYPKRYEDRRRIVPVALLKDGEPALTRLTVLKVIKAPPFGGGKNKSLPMKVYCGDDSGSITLLFFNARWLGQAFEPGNEFWVYGSPRRDMYGVSMVHPDFEQVSTEEEKQTGQIVPVYRLTAGITQKYLRSLIKAALPAAQDAGESLPDSVIQKRRLAPLGAALKNIHYPDDEHAFRAARYRLIYEEFYQFQIQLLRARKKLEAPRVEKEGGKNIVSAEELFSMFPFQLTGAQRRAIDQIRTDMGTNIPMKRLLQGDVGSGKTAVAACAAFMAAGSGMQTAIMAPTEILAAQHYNEFTELFKNTGIKVGILTSGLSASQKNECKKGLETGEIQVVIGTHALIEPGIVFSNLGLVVTDEQHRFGVRQRLALNEKGNMPDTLVMTATPIPRTLAMMLYADLDVSSLDEMPPGRQQVTTRFIDSSKREMAYDFAGKEMKEGRQVYVVAPMIGDEDEEEAEDNEGGSSMASAVELAEELKEYFPDRKAGLLHGRMKSEEKEEIMREFAGGKIDILVSTVVIEVGVNVPNATMMIVENAERFGLAQLHQLRGRVGRGAAKSYCVLISDSKSETALSRLETLAGEHDGFRIAELDLQLRGPGDVFGTRQHGLPELKIADIAEHREILKTAHEDALQEIERCG